MNIYLYPNFTKLIARLRNLGWYSRERELISFKMLGSFEGYSGRASETWEHKYEIKIEGIDEIGLLPIHKIGYDLEKMSIEINKELDGQNNKEKTEEKKKWKGEF
jgi:hypothetical protein